MPLEAVARVVAETRLAALTARAQAHAPEFQFVVLVTGEHFGIVEFFVGRLACARCLRFHLRSF
jgi:hypothetical protein